MAGTDPLQILIYLSALLLVWVPYGLIRRRRSARSRSLLHESRQLGLLEPASLHPRRQRHAGHHGHERAEHRDG